MPLPVAVPAIVTVPAPVVLVALPAASTAPWFEPPVAVALAVPVREMLPLPAVIAAAL